MLQNHILLFDSDIEGTGAIYSSPDTVEALGAAAARRIWGLVSNVSGTSPTLTVELEEANDVGDSRYWAVDAPTPVVNAASLSATAVTVVSGYDNAALADGALARVRIQLGGTGNPQAHVTLWSTGRSADPSTFSAGTYVDYNELVFDEYVDGTASIYSKPQFNALLSLADLYSIHAAAFIESGTSPTLTLQLEEGPDNFNWGNKKATPEVNAAALTSGALTVATHSVGGGSTFPTSGYMRLRVQLGGTSPRGRVKVWFTGRGEQRRERIRQGE